MNLLFIQQNIFWLGPLILVDLIFKGLALWKAGKHNQLYWFIALFIVNSLAILPIIYLLFFSKETPSK